MAVQNGDILKLDLEENFDEQIAVGNPQNPSFKDTPKIYKAPVRLFRKVLLLLVCFIFHFYHRLQLKSA